MKKTIEQAKTEILALLENQEFDPTADEHQEARRLLAQVAGLLPFETFFGKHFRIKKDSLVFKDNGEILEIALNKSSKLVVLLDSSEKSSDVSARLSTINRYHDERCGWVSWDYLTGMGPNHIAILIREILEGNFI